VTATGITAEAQTIIATTSTTMAGTTTTTFTATQVTTTTTATTATQATTTTTTTTATQVTNTTPTTTPAQVKTPAAEALETDTDPTIIVGTIGGMIVLIIVAIAVALKLVSRYRPVKEDAAHSMESVEIEGEKEEGGDSQLQLAQEEPPTQENVAIVCAGVDSEVLGQYKLENEELRDEADSSFSRQVTAKTSIILPLAPFAHPSSPPASAVLYEDWLREVGIPEDLPEYLLPLLQPNRESKCFEILARPVEASKGQGRLHPNTPGHLRSNSQEEPPTQEIVSILCSGSGSAASSSQPLRTSEMAVSCRPMMMPRASAQKNQAYEDWLSELGISEDLPEYCIPMLQPNRASKQHGILFIPPWRSP